MVRVITLQAVKHDGVLYPKGVAVELPEDVVLSLRGVVERQRDIPLYDPKTAPPDPPVTVVPGVSVRVRPVPPE